MPSLLLPSHHRNGKRRTARRRRIQISLLSAVLNYFIMTQKMSLLYQVDDAEETSRRNMVRRGRQLSKKKRKLLTGT